MDPKRGPKLPGPPVAKAGFPGKPEVPTTAKRNAAFAESVERLDRDIQQLRVDFERFFNGALPFPPEELRGRVQAQLRNLRNATGLGHAESFQVGNLEARFNSFNELFNRRIRDQEEGRKRVAHPPPAAAPEYDASQGIVFGERVSDAAVEALYHGLVAAGEGPRFDVAAFRSYLGKQIEAIRQKTGCAEVQFRLAVEEGKTKLKARPLGAPRG